MNNSSDSLTIQVTKGELYAVLGKYGLKSSGLSPLIKHLKVTPLSSVISDNIKAALDNPVFRKAFNIVANPDLIVNSRIGGGSTGLEEMQLCRNKSQGDTLALVLEDESNNIIIKLFSNYAEYINWFVSNYAGKNKETVANYIPPSTELESFLFILHAIDAFRIASYKGMLNYASGKKAEMKLVEFAQTMEKSIKSRDIRWLLPAFVILTPGLDEYNLDLTPEKSKILVGQNFTVSSIDAASGEGIMTFGEAGKNMGVEFYRSWMLAAGFEINISTASGKKTVSRMFIAPTALANHFVKLENGIGGKCIVNHQAYTSNQLEVKLEEIFEQAMSMKTETFEAERVQVQNNPVNPPIVEARTNKFCKNCGAVINPNIKFCANCGTKV